MPVEVVRSRLAAIHKQLMSAYDAGVGMSSASKGIERQEFVDTFLRQVLPPAFRFGTGDAVDAAGEMSGQLDVVIESPFAPTLPLATTGSARLYPIESVAAVIEVKSSLPAQFEVAVAQAQRFAMLKRQDFASIKVMRNRPIPRHRVPFFIVGYEGWQDVTLLQSKLTAAFTPYGALTLKPLAYARRKEPRAYDGEVALWAFISDLHQVVTDTVSAITDPMAYMR